MAEQEAVSIPPLLRGLSTKEVKSFYNLSRGIRALSLFWILAAAMSVVVFSVSAQDPVATSIHVAFIAIAIIAAYGGWKFRVWGRPLGMALSVVLLFAFPLGTVLGALGLLALWRGKRLYGPGGYSYQQLKEELHDRNQRNVA